MRPDVEAFYRGENWQLWRLLGAHPVAQGWAFTVWAPHARRVQVLGDWNGWDLYRPLELTYCEDGLWRGLARTAQAWQCYQYNVQGPDGQWRMRTDPFALQYELPPRMASLLVQPNDLPRPRMRQGGGADCLQIYEAHVGSWRRHWDGRYYTGLELADGLVPWLCSQHYTHVEFLPLAEHPFDGSWGYQGSGYFAPTARVGGAAGFRALVDRLHEAGLGVIMDFVPVHFAADEGRLGWFDGGPLFELPGISAWGDCCFDLHSGPVRSFLYSAALFWLEQCGCDGLRVDAIGAALWRDGSTAEFFRTLTDGLHARCPGTLLIAEDGGPCAATAPTAAGGLGFDLAWDIGSAPAVLQLLTAPLEARRAGFDALAHGLEFANAQAVHALSHDDCAPDCGSLWARMPGDPAQKLAQLRLLYLLQASCPGATLQFMGSELGQPQAFDPGWEPQWDLLNHPEHRALVDYCAALHRFRAQHPALYRPGKVCWALRDADRGVLALVRQAAGETLLCVFNLSPEPRPGCRLDGVAPGAVCRFAAGPIEGGVHTANGSGWVDLPPLSGAVFGW